MVSTGKGLPSTNSVTAPKPQHAYTCMGNILNLFPDIAGVGLVSNTAAKGDMEIEEEKRINLSLLLYMV